MNIGYQNSQINLSARLVHSYKIDYESTWFEEDRNRLTFKEDGYMDDVHAKRD